MLSASEASGGPVRGSRQKFKFKFSVAAVCACLLLRDSSDLVRACCQALRTLLPEQADSLLPKVELGLVRALPAATISRSRISVDVGMLLYMRMATSQLVEQGA